MTQQELEQAYRDQTWLVWDNGAGVGLVRVCSYLVRPLFVTVSAFGAGRVLWGNAAKPRHLRIATTSDMLLL